MKTEHENTKKQRATQNNIFVSSCSIFGEKETSPKGTLTTPPLNPEADGVALPSRDVSSGGKDTKKNQYAPRKSEKMQSLAVTILCFRRSHLLKAGKQLLRPQRHENSS